LLGFGALGQFALGEAANAGSAASTSTASASVPLSGSDEATTKVLCDLVRQALAEDLN
jgi:hypothetical protein